MENNSGEESLLQKRPLDNLENESTEQIQDENQVKFSHKNEIDPLRTCIKNIEPHMDERQILKNCQKMFKEEEEVKITAILKRKNHSYCILTFETSEQRQLFDKKVIQDKTKWKSRKIKTSSVQYDIQHAKQEKKIHQLEEKKQREDEVRLLDPLSEDVQFEGNLPIQDRICPLYKQPYEQQIKDKRQTFDDILKNISKRAQKALNINMKKGQPDDDSIPEWILSNKCCEMTDFIECDEKDRLYYRNKQEFTVGRDHNNQINVGFTKGNFEKRVILVDPAKDCVIASKESIKIAEFLELYIRETYEKHSIDTYSKLKHTGFWRNVVVRTSEITKECLISLCVANENIEKDQLQTIKKDIKNLFENYGKQSEYTLKCLSLIYYNDSSDCVPVDGNMEILLGESNAYTEIIMGNKFTVSLGAFLQINIPQCEKLYSTIKECAGIDENSVLLDICSGIGTISICIGREAKQIVSIEMCKSACEDNIKNAEINKIENIEVHAEKVENCISEVIQKYSNGQNEIVGIVDPPRAGLHNNVIKTLRTCKGLNKLVYVACNPNAVVDNLLALCLPANSKARQGPPFKIIKALGADLFPQTKHFEAVFVLQRQ